MRYMEESEAKKLFNRSIKNVTIYSDDYEHEFALWASENDIIVEDEYYTDDMESDAEALASAGWGTSEDYGCYQDEY